MPVRGYKSQFWEMRLNGGPYDDLPAKEIFKCIGCGAETIPENGWNGSPSKHTCHDSCPCKSSDWVIGHNNNYRKNFDRIFPTAPGAGL